MAKQLNVNLGFTADTSQAKAQIASLQSELTKLTQQPVSLFGGGKTQQEINSAIRGVAELQQHLKAATNVDTGVLDFAKLSDSIGKSGVSLQAYGEKLRSLGPAGQSAFNQLSNAIAQSEIPIRRSNAMLTQFATTLKNTARWQLSSSMLHGFMGGLQSAVGYAKDLNRSLNDIRIVTGYSVDRMAAFADQANKAAKALSTTTTDYTKASLIYFQQGLNDAEVKERTDITIKMANVSRQSAEIVSDQMTAVWNNFADGTQTLESFADAMVALGAKTASSSDEIAGGLEKFAAIGETIGLSFDYAAAALATITAKTRQSEDVVGTALKTIFARIQGLKLGETLEDGTDLNKYSEALATIEIDIKDAQGNLKDMDTILDEMGAKWKTLARDEQVALAQTVAGVRQYNQLVSLMDNWDFMKENLNTVENSAGALERQAKTYEESWEAASKRVRASMEGIFNELLDDKAFVGILNSFEDILNYIDNVIEGIGGLKGVLMTLGAVLTRVFAQQMAQGLTTMATNIKLMTKSGQQAYQQERSNTIKNFANSLGTTEYSSQEDKTRAAYLKNNLALQQSFIDNESKMSAMEREVNKTLLDRNRILGENAVNAAKTVDTTTEKRSDAKFKVQTEMAQQTGNNAKAFAYENNEFAQTARGLEGIITQQEAVKASMKILGDESLKTSDKISRISKELRASGMSAKEIDKIEKELRESGGEADALIRKLGNLQSRELKKKTEIVYGRGQGNEATMDSYDAMTGRNSEEGVEGGTGISKRTTEEYTNAIRDNIIAKRNAQQANEDLKNSEKGVKQSIEESQGAQKNWANTLVTVSNGVMSLFSALNMLRGIKDVLSNPDMSGWEKFLSVGTTIAMIIPMIVQAIQGLKVAMAADTITTGVNTVAKLLNWAASRKSAQASREEALAQKADTASNNANTKSELANAAAKKVNNGVTKSVGKDGKTRYFQNGKRIKNSVGEELFNKGAGSTGGATKGIGGKLKGWGGQVGKSFGNLGKSLLNFGKAYGVTIAGIAAGLMIMNSGFKKMNATAEAAKKANEVAETARKNLTQAQDAYSSFTQNIDKYTSASEGLKELSQGTAEYKEKLNEANQAALNLIRSQDLMANTDYYVDDNGAIVIKDTEALKTNALNQLLAAQGNEMMARARADEANLALKREEFNKKHVKGDDGFLQTNQDQGTMAAYAGGGMAIGTIIGTVIPGIGNAIGAAVGALGGVIVGGIAGLFATEFNEDATSQEDKALDILADAYGRIGDAVFTPDKMKEVLEKGGINDAELIQSLIDAGSDTQDMVKAINANSEAILAERTAHLVQVFADSAEINTSDYKDEIAKGVAKDYDDVYNANYDKLYGENFNNKGKFTGDSSALFDTYKTQKGADFKGTFKSVDDKGFITYIGADDQEYTVAATDIIGTTATKQTDAEMVSRGEDITERITTSEKTDDFLVQDYGISTDLTYADYDAQVGRNEAADKEIEHDLKWMDKFLQDPDHFTQDKLDELLSTNPDFIKQYNEKASKVDWYSDDWNDATFFSDIPGYKEYYDFMSKNFPNYDDFYGFGVGIGGGNINAYDMEDGRGKLSDPTRAHEFLTKYFEGHNTSEGTAPQQLNEVQTQYDDIIKNLSDKSKMSFANEDYFKQMSFNNIDNMNWLTTQGDKGIPAFEKLITESLAPDNAELQKKIYEALAGIDFSELGAGDRAMELLKAENLIPDGEIKKAEEKIDKFVDGLSGQKVAEIYEDAAASVGMSGEAFQSYVKQLQKTYPALKDNEMAAIRVAKAMADQEKKLKTLGEKYGDLKERLDKSKEGTADYMVACEELAGELNNVFGEDVFNSEDVAANADIIKKALEGDIAAINQLYDIAGQEILIEAGVDLSDGTIAQEVNDWIGSQQFNDLKIGATLDSTGMTDTFNDMFTNGEIWVDDMNKLLKGVGFDPVIDYKEMPIDEVTLGEHNQEQEVEVLVPDESSPGGFKKEKMTLKSAVETHGGSQAKVMMPYIKGGDTIKTTAPKNFSNGVKSGNPKTGGSKPTGNSNKPKTVKPTKSKKKNDEVERYHEINQELEDLQNTLDEIANLKDEAWGADKLAAMDKEKKKLQEITASHKKYQAEIAKNLNDDRWEAETKYGAKIDSATGRITNYEELQEQWMNEWNAESKRLDALEQEYENKIAAASDETKETLEEEKEKNVAEVREKLDEDYEEKRKAIEQYEETLNLSEEAQRQLDDYLRQMRELNYEQLEYKLEIRVELNENDIADIEHQLERLGDNNVYASAERIALIEKNAVSYRNIADAQIEAIKEAERLYQQYLASDGKEGISKEDYMTRLQESKEALQDAEMSIRDGIQQIGEELSNTFDLVDEKLDQQFTKFDRLIELMDHYKNVVSLAEGEASYKEFNKILKASQEVLRDRIEADKSEVAMWESRRKQLEADIATLPEDSPAKREAEEALQAIMEKEADAKSQLMADIEQLGEYAREIFENSIEQAMKDFEDEMFGRPLNSIIESIEMMNSRQEELLTTTNKIYETNKLIRNVEKDIEATTNNRAKQAYLEFQNKVKQKQEQNELTKFELDLLTAEYEITKAQIALEEAQNAKDTVRLTRDAEGNYGYVYTANEDKVADAEQALDDATNNYYNTALEGAQKYQDQIYQHIQEWEEKVKEVYLDQTLSEEEKNKKIKEINDTYNTLIAQDKNLYYMAIGAMQESAYNTQVDYDLKGIESAENWFTECDGFLSDLEDAQDEYDRNTEEVSDHTEENFGRMSTAIRETKQESEYLKDQIVDELVPELDTTLKDSIDNATEAWWKYIEALQEVIRLTDEAMQKNSDEKYYGTIDDFSQEIYDKISSGEYDINDPEIQALIERRWKKMGGEDNYDYTAMMSATDDPIWDSIYNTLREYKIANTDWMAKIQEAIKSGKKLSDIQWMIDIRDEKQKKLGQTPDSLEQAKKYAESIGATLATGGYTGSWGPEGKLAVLHEKELVLNAEDTKNFLSATGILREISQMLDRDALIASLGAINLRAMTLNSPADQVLQQEVTIHADFPNVTDHNEIEIAIDNLINAASQHAYRT